jgi:putative DNA primase/helicase
VNAPNRSRLRTIQNDPEVAAIVAEARERRAQGEVVGPADLPGASDDELAARFTRRYAADLRYVAAWDAWLEWDGARWARDEKRATWDLARRVCREVGDELAVAATSDVQHRRIRAKTGSATTVMNVVKLASADPRHAVAVRELDADPWLLNTPDGVVDLRSGEVYEHDRGALHTKVTAASLGGECPRFLSFLERIQPDPNVRAYLQRLAGYALTGSARDHVLPFWYGVGRNGKGTLAHALRAALGDYAIEIPAETLMESHHERHPTELAQLRGARLVVGSEVDTGRRWNEARLKRLTGGDPISARYIAKDYFEFDPSHTLVLIGNHKPGLRSVDEAIRARIHLVSFDVVIPAEERDATLPEALRAEYGGILAWALEGCVAWQKSGLAPPPSVLMATREYLDSEDGIAGWLSERTEAGPQVKLSYAHRDYSKWCEENAQPPLGRNTFADQLRSRNHVVGKDTRTNTNVLFGRQLRSASRRWNGYDD